jgi:hypothetical protein
MATIRFSTRIAHATDEEASARYALQGTLVTPDGFAVATDGRIAACTKVVVKELTAPTMIPQDLGPASKSDLNAEYYVNGQRRCEKRTVVKGQQRVEQADAQEGRFPKIGGIADNVDPATCSVLAINARHLWRLAQSINVPDTGDVVVLLVPPAGKDGVVSTVLGVLANHESLRAEDSGGFGMIMPCDADAAEARSDFKKLCGAVLPLVDAAAGEWSGDRVHPAESENDTKPAKPKPAKPRRPSRRKRSVA